MPAWVFKNLNISAFVVAVTIVSPWPSSAQLHNNLVPLKSLNLLIIDNWPYPASLYMPKPVTVQTRSHWKLELLMSFEDFCVYQCLHHLWSWNSPGTTFVGYASRGPLFNTWNILWWLALAKMTSSISRLPPSTAITTYVHLDCGFIRNRIQPHLPFGAIDSSFTSIAKWLEPLEQTWKTQPTVVWNFQALGRRFALSESVNKNNETCCCIIISDKWS